VLNLDVNGRLTCLGSRGRCPVPVDAAELTRGGGENDWLLYPTPLTGAEEQFAEFGSAVLGSCPKRPTLADWVADRPAVAAGLPQPFRSAQEYFYFSNAVPARAARALADAPSPPAYSLQYWFFYPSNYLPLRVPRPNLLGTDPDQSGGLNFDYHQGDFEHVDVLLDAGLDPVGIYMARHDNEDQTFAWDDSDHLTLEPDPGDGRLTHP